MRYMSKDGHPVYNIGGHLDQHEDVVPFLAEAISKIQTSDFYPNQVFAAKVDMGRIIGKTVCVPTTRDDDIVHAKRVGRSTDTRFVKNREPVDTQFIAVVLAWKPRAKCFQIVTAYIGVPAPREPDDRSLVTMEELRESLKFWNEHALIFGSQTIHEHTIKIK